MNKKEKENCYVIHRKGLKNDRFKDPIYNYSRASLYPYPCPPTGCPMFENLSDYEAVQARIGRSVLMFGCVCFRYRFRDLNYPSPIYQININNNSVSFMKSFVISISWSIFF